MVAALAVANVDASSTPSTASRGRLQNSKLRNIIPPLNKTLLKSQFKITNKTTGIIISHMQKKEASSMLAPLVWWTMTGSNCRHPACKAGALPAELIVHVVTRPGIEPGIPP